MISTSMPRIVFVKSANDSDFFKDENKLEYNKKRNCCKVDLGVSDIDEMTRCFKAA
jgi:hypothetical protein